MEEVYNSNSGKATNVLMVVAVIAVVMSLAGVVLNLTKTPTGYANVESGNATLEILGVASINFTNNLINWSVGKVNDTCGAQAMLVTNGTNICSSAAIPAETWNIVPLGLVVRNVGSTDVTLELVSDKDAAAFIGPPSPGYQWMISNYEAGSCAGTLSDTSWTDVATGAARTICTNFLADLDDGSSDELRIDLRVMIDQGASAGQRVSTITATATSI